MEFHHLWDPSSPHRSAHPGELPNPSSRTLIFFFFRFSCFMFLKFSNWLIPQCHLDGRENFSTEFCSMIEEDTFFFLGVFIHLDITYWKLHGVEKFCPENF
jgi:hypothetical protein